MKSLLYLFVISVIMIGCEKEDNFGTVTFYTNAQFALN